MRFWGAGENSRRRRLLLRATTAQGCYYCRSSSGTVDALTLANVLDAGTDDTLLAIAVALSTPADLLRLALTCRAAAQRFYFTATSYSSGSAVPSGGAASGGTAAAAAAQQAETWSIIEEAARQWIATYTDQERGWVPRRGRGSWLGLILEVESLRRGAVFGPSHEGITVSAGGAVATVASNAIFSGQALLAASKAVMRAGRHYVQFTVVSVDDDMFFGVIRPGWVAERGKDVQHVDVQHMISGHCFYWTGGGNRYPGFGEWEGMQHAREDGDRIGLLLDLDKGTLTVYRNDSRLGVMHGDRPER